MNRKHIDTGLSLKIGDNKTPIVYCLSTSVYLASQLRSSDFGSDRYGKVGI